MQNYLSDHGERNKRYNSQVNRLNVLTKPLGNYLSNVKGRIGAFMDSPSNALYDAYSKQIGVNLDLPISEYAKMAQNPQPGKIDPNSPAMREAMSWLPGPADNIGGLIGSVVNKSSKIDPLAFEKSVKTNLDSILSVNKYGMENPNGFDSFRTPIHQMAYELGQSGVDLSKQPVVKGWRRGKPPESGISSNYRDDISERGLSLMAIDNGKPGFSEMFMGDREKYNVEGILLPKKGSDNENLVLPFGFDNFDATNYY